MNQAGENVLAAVVLHEVKAPLPVDGALDRLAHGKGPVAVVDDVAVRFMGVRDGSAA